jgi:hypothetical protein
MAEIGILVPIYVDLASIHNNDASLSQMDYDDLTFPYYENILELLRPWSAYLNVSSASHIGSLDKDQINGTLLYFSRNYQYLARIHKQRNQFNLAENYCQQALSYARMFEGEEEPKTNLLCKALTTSYEFHTHQENYAKASISRELLLLRKIVVKCCLICFSGEQQ